MPTSPPNGWQIPLSGMRFMIRRQISTPLEVQSSFETPTFHSGVDHSRSETPCPPRGSNTRQLLLVQCNSRLLLRPLYVFKLRRGRWKTVALNDARREHLIVGNLKIQRRQFWEIGARSQRHQAALCDTRWGWPWSNLLTQPHCALPVTGAQPLSIQLIQQLPVPGAQLFSIQVHR